MPLMQAEIFGTRAAGEPTTVAAVHTVGLVHRYGARLALADRRRELVQYLPGGLARRVELAKGLLHRPELLILDEPSTGLDPGARRDLWQYLRQLKEEGITILLTTHLIEEADRCERI